MNAVKHLTLIASPLVAISIFGCGQQDVSDNPNNMSPSAQIAEPMEKPDGEDGKLGIVGGQEMNSQLSLMKHLRAVRHAFETVPETSTSKTSAARVKVDRWCGGVALSEKVTLTAGHCVSLMNHNLDVFIDYFTYQEKNKNIKLIPFKANNQFTVFFANLSSKYVVPAAFPTLTKASEGVPSNARVASHVNAWPKADAGFVHTWGSFDSGRITDKNGRTLNTGTPVKICTHVPKVNDKIIVTGLKIKPIENGAKELNWAMYPAQIISVFDAESEFYDDLVNNVGWVASPPKSAMAFVSEGINKADCAESGDSGSGVFVEIGNGDYCLLGINSARGMAISNEKFPQSCRPTLHRRITNQMVSKFPKEQPSKETTYMGQKAFLTVEDTAKSRYSIEGDVTFQEFNMPVDNSLIVKTNSQR